nr:CBO0543 family protein [Halobacillus sp. A5]
MLPWIVVIFIFKIDLKIILLIAPLASIVTHILNTITIAYGFVAVAPYSLETNFASIPMVLGIIPAISTVLIHLIRKHGFDIGWIIIFACSTALFEWLLLSLGFVKYHNGWTIIWTFIVYIIGYYMVYGYYKILNRLQYIH